MKNFSTFDVIDDTIEITQYSSETVISHTTNAKQELKQEKKKKNPVVVDEVLSTRTSLGIFIGQSNKQRKYTSFSLSMLQQMRKKSKSGRKEVLERNFRFKKIK